MSHTLPLEGTSSSMFPNLSQLPRLFSLLPVFSPQVIRTLPSKRIITFLIQHSKTRKRNTYLMEYYLFLSVTAITCLCDLQRMITLHHFLFSPKQSLQVNSLVESLSDYHFPWFTKLVHTYIINIYFIDLNNPHR